MTVHATCTAVVARPQQYPQIITKSVFVPFARMQTVKNISLSLSPLYSSCHPLTACLHIKIKGIIQTWNVLEPSAHVDMVDSVDPLKASK
jgi:hypothetical protein